MSPKTPRFDWDEANLEHIARHKAAPLEVEAAFPTHFNWLMWRRDVNQLYETVPDFASETEEAEYLDAHANELDGEFAEASANGTLMRREEFRQKMQLEQDVLWPDARVSLNISNDDLACVKAMATTSGQSAEEYLGQVVHEALSAKRAA